MRYLSVLLGTHPTEPPPPAFLEGLGTLGEETMRSGALVDTAGLGEDTRRLEHEAPRLWAYLERHAAAFDRRRSSIYRGQPPFAMFGLGPYSFAPYKVAVSGLSKEPAFHALGPVAGRPVMLDDTCYFLPCRTPEQCALAAALLNDRATLGLLRALTFRDAKRPVTKSVLARIDLPWGSEAPCLGLLDAVSRRSCGRAPGIGSTKRTKSRTFSWQT